MKPDHRLVERESHVLTASDGMVLLAEDFCRLEFSSRAGFIEGASR